jgi:hypothetical protein
MENGGSFAQGKKTTSEVGLVAQAPPRDFVGPGCLGNHATSSLPNGELQLRSPPVVNLNLRRRISSPLTIVSGHPSSVAPRKSQ